MLVILLENLCLLSETVYVEEDGGHLMPGFPVYDCRNVGLALLWSIYYNMHEIEGHVMALLDREV